MKMSKFFLLVGVILAGGFVYTYLQTKNVSTTKIEASAAPTPNNQLPTVMTQTESSKNWIETHTAIVVTTNVSLKIPGNLYTARNLRGSFPGGIEIYVFPGASDYLTYKKCLSDSAKIIAEYPEKAPQTTDWEGGCNMSNLLMTISIEIGGQLQETGLDNIANREYVTNLDPLGLMTNKSIRWYIPEEKDWPEGMGTSVDGDASGITQNGKVVKLYIRWPTRGVYSKTPQLTNMSNEDFLKELAATVLVN